MTDIDEYYEAEGQFNRATQLYGENKPDKALKIFETLQNKYSAYIDEWNLYEWMGLCHIKLGQYESAIKSLTLALKNINKEEEEYNYLIICDNLALVYFRVYEYKSALPIFKMAEDLLDLYIQNNRIDCVYAFHLTYGKCYYYLGRFESAISHFVKSEKYMELDGDKESVSEWLAILFLYWGSTYVYLRDLPKAEYYLGKTDIRLLEPEHHYKYYFFYGKLYMLTHDYGKAYILLKQYEDLGIIECDKSEVYYYLGIIHHIKHEDIQAIDYFNKSLEFESVDDWVHEEAKNLLNELL